MTEAFEGDEVLRVEGLRTCFDVEGRRAWAVDGVDFTVRKGEVFGIVGESGSGKSVTSLSVLRLIPDPPGRIEEGAVYFHGQNLLDMSWAEIREVRGRDISMIFQEPMTSLNPVMTIGKQVAEPLMEHTGKSLKDSEDDVVAALESVGIPDARKRLKDYPHQFSGGMRQRVMIAMALVCKPALLIADEPTTALDVTIQAQILDLMRELKTHREGASIMLITHDLSVVAEMCDRVMVMYGGKVQELADVHTLFASPKHPYTLGLMQSIPKESNKGQELTAIPGNVPSIFSFPPGCKFSTRCPFVNERCRREEPKLMTVSPGHEVRCHAVEEGRL